MENCSLVDYDFFEISCSEPITYELDLSPESSHRKFFLSNLFCLTSTMSIFERGRWELSVKHCQEKEPSACYQRAPANRFAINYLLFLQPAISFVVCPIKKLNV